LNFTYCLQSIGWVNIHLQIGESEFYINPSYLTEPLIDLVKSIELLMPECVPLDEVKKVVQFEMDSEPAIHVWKIEKLSEKRIEIEITYYEDGIKSLPGKIEFKQQCDLNEFIESIVNSMETLLKKHGFIGYRKQWYAQEFPLSSYIQLKNYLVQESNFPIKINNPDEWNEWIESNLSNELKLIEKIL
jgi:hypothetical protein